MAGPVALTLRFYSGKGRKGRPPDLDNLIKLVQDSLTGILWKDDAQVKRLVAERFHGQGTPRTEIEWEEL